MNYLDEIFLRTDIQQIREFLLHGVEGSIDPRPYKERAESAERRLTARLRQACPDMGVYEELSGLVYDYAGAVKAVYMEIGLQAGAILAAQVGQNLKTALKGE